MQFNKSDLIQEINFSTSRSSGKGGQHINKVESRVSLFFNIKESAVLDDDQKNRLIHSSALNVSKEKILQIDVDHSRSQIQNKKIALERFFKLLEEALKVPKKRKASKPSKKSIEKRLKDKKLKAEKKNNRNYRKETD